MKITLIVEVELRHTQGKFASKEDLTEKLIEEVEGSDPGTVESDDGAEYEVDSFEVRVHE